MIPSSSPEIEWNLDVATWTEALARCPGATFFHTVPWLATVRDVVHSQIVRVRATLPDGRWALLPLSIRPLVRGLVPLAVAGETGAYSGLVSPEPLQEADAAAIYARIRRRYPNMHVVGNPFWDGSHLPGAAEVSVATESTHVLHLKPFQELRAGFSRGAKSRGNKVRKLGLELAVSSDAAAVEAFYPLYQDSVKRWGERLTWARPREFFDRLVSHGGPDVRLFIARADGEPVSGLVMASYGSIVHYVAGATRADWLEASPANFLMEESLAHYAGAGYAMFDFGPSNGLPGVVRFKESFGATPLTFAAVTSRTLAGRAYFALRAPLDRLGAWRANGWRTTSPDTEQPAA